MSVKTALIIATYKQSEYLDLLLRTLDLQTVQPDQVIVAEDAEDCETANVVKAHEDQHAFSLIHVSHADQGFRKSTILNKAVAATQATNLLFLDGDCLPHPKFVEEYERFLKPGVMLFGRPVYLHERFVEKLVRRRRPLEFSVLELLLNRSRSVEAGLYLPFRRPSVNPNRKMLGNGWGCTRGDFVLVNGFDERFNEGQYGFEDTDLHHRMERAGIVAQSVKNLAIYYHFGRSGIGEAKSEERTRKNQLLMEENDQAGLVKALTGLSQWTKPTKGDA